MCDRPRRFRKRRIHALDGMNEKAQFDE